MASRFLALVLLALSVLLAPASAAAQDSESTTTTVASVPDQDIVPKPNTGEAPHDAGDRGGALQLAVLGLVALAIGGTIAVVVRQSRRARAGSS